MCLSNFNLRRSFLPLLIKGIVLLCTSYRIDAKNFGTFAEHGTVITLTGTQLIALNRFNLNQATSATQSDRFQNCTEWRSTLEFHPSLFKGSNSSCKNETRRILEETNSKMDSSPNPGMRHSESLSFEEKIPTLAATSSNLNVLHFHFSPDFNGTSATHKTSKSYFNRKTGKDVDSFNVNHVSSMEGRIFKKKISNFFKNKLLLSFIALIVIIKLIKIKLFWLLPIILGVGTAKKILLNFILFVFPALSHLFELCSTYHAERLHDSKYHLHQHKITHHYAIHPDWHKGHGSTSSVFIPNGPELIFTRPPKGNVPIFHHKNHVPAPTYYRQPSITTDWEVSGPGLGAEYIGDLSRNDHNMEQNLLLTRVNENIKRQNDENISVPVKTLNKGHYTFGSQLIENKEQLSFEWFAEDNASKDLPWVSNIQNGAAIQGNVQLGIMPNNSFSDILQRIDEIFQLFGPLEESCKRLLVCQMYRNPNKFRPYSNFMSAELSRDINDLKKSAVEDNGMLRFLKFVEAAMIGQEEKDCAHLLNECSTVQGLPSW